MRIAKPDAIEIEYVRQMMMWTLFDRRPAHRLVGLRHRRADQFCYRHFPDARVTAIELNPAVIALCRSTFALPPNDAHLSVLEMDALDYVLGPANHDSIDVLQVDLYDADARGPVLDTPRVLSSLRRLPDGGRHADRQPVRRLRQLRKKPACDGAGIRCRRLAAGGPTVHVVVIAFKRAPEIEFGTLYQRAANIRLKMNLPAKSWVNGLKAWMLAD